MIDALQKSQQNKQETRLDKNGQSISDLKKPLRTAKTFRRIVLWILSLLIIFALMISLWYQLFFLRLPKRLIVEDPNVFLSPANGKIIAIIKEPTTPLEKKHRVVIEDAMRDT